MLKPIYNLLQIRFSFYFNWLPGTLSLSTLLLLFRKILDSCSKSTDKFTKKSMKAKFNIVFGKWL